MADNRKDIELRIAATTTGSDAIRKIGEDLAAVGDTGSASAKKAQELNTALAAIGKQGDAVATLDKIEQTVGDTSAKFDAATQRVKELGAALATQQGVTEGFRQRQTEAAVALKTTAATLAEQRAALNTLNAEYDRVGKATVGYKEKVEPLRKEIALLENTLVGQKAAFKEAKDAAAGAGGELSALEGQYKKAGAAVATLERSLTKQAAELTGAKAALSALGVEATDTATALVKVEAALDANAKAAVEVIAANTRLVAIEQTVAAANERNAALARKAAADRAIAAQNAEFDARQQSAANARLNAEIDTLTAKFGAEATAAKQAGDALEKAFGTVGVRSAATVRAEIERVQAALALLKDNAAVSGAEFDKAFVSSKAKVAALERELQGLPPVIEKSAGLAGVLRQSFSQFTAAFGAFEAGRQLIAANVQLETLRRSLALTTGSVSEANRQIALLQDIANKAGVPVRDISDSFVKFQASLSGANIPLAVTEKLFKATISAAGQLGLSGARAGLILDALAQTASKGVVSMEELRQQLGDSLPGALNLTAKGLGITTAELVKITESGQLLAADFLPALERALTNTYGKGASEVKGLGAEIARLKNQLDAMFQSLGDSGFSQILIASIKGIGIALGPIVLGFNTLLDLFTTGAKQLGTIASLVVTRDFKGVNAELNRLFEESVDRQAKVALAYRKMIGVDAEVVDSHARVITSTKALNDSSQTLGAQVSAVATAQAGAVPSAQAHAAAIDATATAAQGSVAAQGAATAATVAGAAAAGAAVSSWVGLTLAYQKEIEALTTDIDVADKLSAAKKIEGEARLAVAKITGDSNTLLQVSAAAAAAEAEALTKEADKRLLLVQRLEAEKAELKELIKVLGDEGGQRTQQVEKLQKTIDLKTADAEKSVQAAASMRVEASARALAVKATEDNSKALSEIKAAYEQSRATLALYVRAEQLGVVSAEKVRVAREEAARAEFLYNDALKDNIRNLQLRAQTIQADFNISKASLDVRLAVAKADEQVAKGIGDETKALSAKIEQKRIEIEITKASQKAKADETQATIAALTAQRDDIRGTDDISIAKRAEIDLRIKNEQAKLIEAKASEQVVRGLQTEVDALNKLVEAQRFVVGGFNAVSQATKDAENAALRYGSVLQQARYDAQKFLLDASGGRFSAAVGDGTTFTPGAPSGSQIEQLKATRDAALAKQQRLQFNETNNRAFNGAPILTTGVSPSFVQSQRDTVAAASRQAFAELQAAEDALRAAEAAVKTSKANSALDQVINGQSSSAAIAADKAAGRVPIVINLNGTSRNLTVASEAEAQVLIGLLQQIGAAASRAGG